MEYNYGVSKKSTDTPLVERGVLGSEILCSCVKYVREYIPELPRGNADDFFANTTIQEGVAAIFWFPTSPRYPNGTKHLAYVDEVIGDYFHIKQSNKETCKETQEWISPNNPYFIGFYTP